METELYGGQVLLSIQMIVDDLDRLGWICQPRLSGDSPRFRGWQFFDRKTEPAEDTLYLVSGEDAAAFPGDRFAFVSADAVPGSTGIRCPGHELTEIANVLIAVFRRYQDYEAALNQVVNSGGTLTELCRAAESFFHNPIFIHDNMFVLIGYPRDIDTTDSFSHNAETGIHYLPLSRIDEFRFDPEYHRTYLERHPAIWNGGDTADSFRSLYVNLFDGEQLYGRLLINERLSALSPGQFTAAEYLAKYAMMIIRRDAQSMARSTVNFQDTFSALALGKPVPGKDVEVALSILSWDSSDRYLCIRLCSQDSSARVSPVLAVQSTISRNIEYSVFFLTEGELCFLVNIGKSGRTPSQICQSLAPHIRDNFLFCGVSNPFVGLASFPAAFYQAGISLEFASNPTGGSWLMPFERCALDYIEDTAKAGISPELLVAPQILKLRTYDREKSTEYYRTLRAYLYHACDITATARALIIHRTTLTYRLEKMKELIPMDFDHPDYRLYLQLSFHLLDRADRGQGGNG